MNEFNIFYPVVMEVMVGMAMDMVDMEVIDEDGVTTGKPEEEFPTRPTKHIFKTQ